MRGPRAARAAWGSVGLGLGLFAVTTFWSMALRAEAALGAALALLTVFVAAANALFVVPQRRRARLPQGGVALLTGCLLLAALPSLEAPDAGAAGFEPEAVRPLLLVAASAFFLAGAWGLLQRPDLAEAPPSCARCGERVRARACFRCGAVLWGPPTRRSRPRRP